MVCGVGIAFSQTTSGSQPTGGQPAGANAPQSTGNKQQDWLAGALNGIEACYRNAMERLQEAANKVDGDFQKDLLNCKPPAPQSCSEAARKKMNDAMLPIDRARIDAQTIKNNLRARVETAHANGGQCTTGGCCTNQLGTSAPAVGPDGRSCNMQGNPSGYGNCDANFQNILNGY